MVETGETTSDGRDLIPVVRRCLGRHDEAVHVQLDFVQRQRPLDVVALGRDGVGSAEASYSLVPDGSSVLVGISGSSSSVNAREVRAEDEDIVFSGWNNFGGMRHDMSFLMEARSNPP